MKPPREGNVSQSGQPDYSNRREVLHVTLPTFTEMVASVTSFISDYAVIFAASAVLGVMVAVAGRFVKSGR